MSPRDGLLEELGSKLRSANRSYWKIIRITKQLGESSLIFSCKGVNRQFFALKEQSPRKHKCGNHSKSVDGDLCTKRRRGTESSHTASPGFLWKKRIMPSALFCFIELRRVTDVAVFFSVLPAFCRHPTEKRKKSSWIVGNTYCVYATYVNNFN